ncbi:MAG: hypothetical protein ICV83_27660 [Cytophagales bacterium]|nr:hypothetical protein [Cytophagales bacterium]
MKVIFLDLDGVIVTNHYLSRLEQKMQPWRDAAGYAHFCPRCLANVEELVARSGASVVLSSTWRFFLEDLAGVRRFFRSRNIRFAIHDVTPLVDYYPGKPSRNADRGREIAAWLEAHPEVTRYCILDDDPRILPEQRPYWVRTTFHYGFTRARLEKALRILAAEPGGPATAGSGNAPK